MFYCILHYNNNIDIIHHGNHRTQMLKECNDILNQNFEEYDLFIENGNSDELIVYQRELVQPYWISSFFSSPSENFTEFGKLIVQYYSPIHNKSKQLLMNIDFASCKKNLSNKNKTNKNINFLKENEQDTLINELKTKLTEIRLYVQPFSI